MWRFSIPLVLVLPYPNRGSPIVSNSAFLRSQMSAGLRASDRRSFLKWAVGAVGEAATGALSRSQTNQSANTSSRMFDGFRLAKVQTTGAASNVVSGEQGPPVLLLHGRPQTHVMWQKVARSAPPSKTLTMTVIAASATGSVQHSTVVTLTVP